MLEQEGTFDCSALDLPVEEKDLPLKGVQYLGFGVEATALSLEEPEQRHIFSSHT